MIIRTSTLYDFIFWQWSMRFEGEEVKVVALGASWVAAVTSFNYLRIFTEGGMQVCRTFTAYLNAFQSSIIESICTFQNLFLLQRHVISLDGPVVTASGFKDKLAVVTHASDRLSSNDQVWFYLVLLYTIRLQIPTNIQSF
jgi:chromosome transmission fidelity protein 4